MSKKKLNYDLNRKEYERVKKMDHSQMQQWASDIFTKGGTIVTGGCKGAVIRNKRNWRSKSRYDTGIFAVGKIVRLMYWIRGNS